MNGQHLRALPPEELLKIFGDRWKCTGVLLESEGIFIKVRFRFHFLPYLCNVGTDIIVEI